MTELLEKAFSELSSLPDEQQNTMAQWILEATLVGHHGTSKIMSSRKSVSKRESHLIKKELEDDQGWANSFANSLPQLEELAKKAIRDYEKGQTRDLNLDELE